MRMLFGIFGLFIYKMQSDTEIKIALCYACLSSDRKLNVLGELSHELSQTFWQICFQIDSALHSEIFLCWECRSLVEKVKYFQDCVTKAQNILTGNRGVEHSLPICFSNLIVSDTLTLDTFEDEEEQDSLHTKPKEELDIESMTYKIGLEEEYLDEKFTKQLIDQSGEEVIQKGNKNYTDSKIKNKKQRHKIRNYPKERRQEIVSETLTLDTFEDEEKQDSLHTKPKEELDIESMTYKIGLEEEYLDEKFTKQIIDQSGEEVIQKGDQNCTNPKKQRLKIRNYPKERSRQYVMNNQSLKWNDAVQKVQINDTELKEWLERERNSKHFQTLKNKCDICLQKLRMDDNIWRHKKECHIATKSYPYGCDICGVHYQSKPLLRAHIRRHYYSRRCSICGYECYSQLHMRYHLRKSHQRIVTCAVCQHTFKNTRDFYVHLRSHPAVDQYFCDQCHKRTRSLRCLETHIKRHHMTQRCEECNKTFRDHRRLSTHMKHKHTYNPSEESFCVACDKQFHNVHTYRKHLTTAAVHLQEAGKKRNKKVPCPVCFKIYSKNETMMNHYRWVHTNDSKYRCEQCDKAFLNRTKYKHHMEYTHMGMQKPRNKICRFCSRGFTTNQALSHHILIHTGEKPHACPYCPQRYRQKVAMQSHVKNIHEKTKEKTNSQTQDNIYVVVSS